MKITEVYISSDAKTKMFEKHNVLASEIDEMLYDDEPKFRKVGGNQYMCIGYSKSRYLTVFFEHNENNTIEITTAYPSDDGQVKSYKRAK